MVKFLDLHAQYISIKNEIDFEIQSVISKSSFIGGQYVKDFEKSFANYQQANYCVGVGNGTDALEIAIEALDLPNKSEIIVPANSFISSAEAVARCGHKIVFCDINQDDYTINIEDLKSRITPETSAIVAVHLYGHPCDIDSLIIIAKKYNLKIIEDCAQSHGAKYKGQKVGAIGDIGCFSFHPLKNLNVWGDAGIIATNSDEIAEGLKLMRNHGLKGRDECLRFAYNSRLDTIQAVVAGHLLDKIDHITQSRIQNAVYLDKHLSSVPQVIIPVREAYIKQVYHLYSVRCERRDELKAYLIDHGVDAKIHYPVPMHLQPAADYLKYQTGDFPVAEQISASTLSLPVHEFINQQHLDKMIHLIEEFYR